MYLVACIAGNKNSSKFSFAFARESATRSRGEFVADRAVTRPKVVESDYTVGRMNERRWLSTPGSFSLSLPRFLSVKISLRKEAGGRTDGRSFTEVSTRQELGLKFRPN